MPCPLGSKHNNLICNDLVSDTARRVPTLPPQSCAICAFCPPKWQYNPPRTHSGCVPTFAERCVPAKSGDYARSKETIADYIVDGKMTLLKAPSVSPWLQVLVAVNGVKCSCGKINRGLFCRNWVFYAVCGRISAVCDPARAMTAMVMLSWRSLWTWLSLSRFWGQRQRGGADVPGLRPVPS